MAVKTVTAVINGTTTTLTLNESTGLYEATITAPTSSSYSQEGHYYGVSLTATDDAGNSTTVDSTDAEFGSALQLVVKETVAPVITITAPTSGELTADSTPTVKFTVTDDDSGVDSSTIALAIDGNAVANSDLTITEIEGGYSVEYTPTTALEDGEHTVSVNASDNDGNAATEASISFNILATAPSLSVTAPTEGSYTNVSAVTVEGTSDGASVTVKVGEGEAVEATLSEGAFTADVTLTEGENSIVVTATSKSGVTTIVTRTVYLDTVAPKFVSVTITPNPVDAGATYILSVEVTDE